MAGGCSGGQPPVNFGVSEGRLAPCPSSPNCVSSQAADEQQWVHPLRYEAERARARAQLLAVLDGMDRAEIVQADENYIHAQFRSAVFGFVDDVEFLFDPPGFIQVRSAARSGYYDFGVNHERVERIRVRFNEAMANP
ncbi:MAG: DUF1499 domain-containing protein [Candidatus Competibacteraceae bacterium]|nr:MAG: DUF1499 domain-containing protein [Candidatus Competibacteraceae bacterium]